MKCHQIIELWKGIETRDDLQRVLPEPWLVGKGTFISKAQADKAKAEGRKTGTHPYAWCVVPADVKAPCEKLIESLYERIWEVRFPDDGEAGHEGETASTYGRGSKHD